MSTNMQQKIFNNHPKYQVEEVTQAEFLAVIKQLQQKDANSRYIEDLEAKFLAQLS